MGMVGGTAEANPTATPWLVAVTLASPDLLTLHLFMFPVCHILCFTSQPAHQHHQKGGTGYPNDTMRVCSFPSSPLHPILHEGKQSDLECSQFSRLSFLCARDERTQKYQGCGFSPRGKQASRMQVFTLVLLPFLLVKMGCEHACSIPLSLQSDQSSLPGL